MGQWILGVCELNICGLNADRSHIVIRFIIIFLKYNVLNYSCREAAKDKQPKLCVHVTLWLCPLFIFAFQRHF